jgi:steroid delta-isomerase-like uncharacterized protein
MTTTPPQSGIAREFANAFGARWLEAWNSRNPSRLLELMSEDIVYDDSAWPKTMRGHEDVREFLEHIWRAFPDLTFELLEGPYVDPTAPRAAYWWRAHGTHQGTLEPAGLRPTGKPVEFDGVDFHHYRDGKVERLRIIFDMAGAMRQLGVLPAAGTREERTIVGLSNIRTSLRGRRPVRH